MSEGWQDGIVVTVSVNDLPHEVTLNEGVADDDDDDGNDGDDGPGPGPAARARAAPPAAPAAPPAPPAAPPAPPAAPAAPAAQPEQPDLGEELQVIGRDSVEAVLQGLDADNMLEEVLQDMGVGGGRQRLPRCRGL